MRPRNVFLFCALAVSALAVSALASNGCCPPRSSGGYPPLTPPARSPLADVNPRPYRVVGLVDSCGEHDVQGKGGKWVGKRVFQPKDLSQRLPDSMRKLCAYDWLPDPKTPAAAPDYDAVDDPANPREPDHPVVMTLGGHQEKWLKLRDARRAEFIKEVGGLAKLPTSPHGNVWIGFPDSSPRNENSQITLGTNPHGFNVAWVARYLTCPKGPGSDQPCISTIHMEPALDHATPPMVAGAVSPEGAGSYGARTALAGAIFNTVEAWKEAVKGKDPKDHLVINLSVGWESDLECSGKESVDKTLSESPSQPSASLRALGRPGQQIPSKLGPTVQESTQDWIRRISGCMDGPGSELKHSVLEAITYAVCHGALVIAAAGNDTGYKPPLTRPVYPAYWENVPMPSQDMCNALFAEPVAGRFSPSGELPTLNTEGEFLPLLYAIGGVGPGDSPIPTTRVNGMPRLVAPASLAVAYPDNSKQDGYPAERCPSYDCSKPLTGTSMAAAVASATAATVWAYLPELSPHQVMDKLYRSGQRLPFTETFYREWRHPRARISFCNAIRATECAECDIECEGRSYDHQMSDGFPAKVIDQSGPRIGVVSGQPGKPGCPDCFLQVMDPNNTQNPSSYEYKIEGSVYNSYFAETGVEQLYEPTLHVYSRDGAQLNGGGTRLTLDGSVDGIAVGNGSPDDKEVAKVGGRDLDLDLAGEVAYAEITWKQRLTDHMTITAFTEGVLISPLQQ